MSSHTFPKATQRLWRIQRLGMPHDVLRRIPTPKSDKQVFHCPEVVMHELRLQAGPFRQFARCDSGVAIFSHHFLGHVQDECSRF